ncbi:rap domain protein [Cystoisospora suis]|uniref:Rap domain protein n=1 Tax=Cystoisospora suis TaxID=483139 RepID=A0A2C6KVM9_9APIC|nr:rap domain protein [Cystoisospora suis]
MAWLVLLKDCLAEAGAAGLQPLEQLLEVSKLLGRPARHRVRHLSSSPGSVSSFASPFISPPRRRCRSESPPSPAHSRYREPPTFRRFNGHPATFPARFPASDWDVSRARRHYSGQCKGPLTRRALTRCPLPPCVTSPRDVCQKRSFLTIPEATAGAGAYARVCPPFTKPFASREEEKAVLSTLAAVQQYTADTKLSLKVYHLQELANTSMSFSQLSLDERFVKLFQDIYAHAKELSPAQLQAVAIACKHLKLKGTDMMWKTIAKHIVRLTKSPSAALGGITFSQVAHSMSCFASCQAEVHWELKQMLAYLLKGSKRLNEHDVICMLYTLRRYKCYAPDSQGRSEWPYLRCLRLCASCAEQRLFEMSPRSLVYIVYECSLIGVVPWRLTYRISSQVKQSLDRLSAKELALYVLASAKYRLVDDQLLKRIGKQLCDERFSSRVSNTSASLLLYGSALLDFRDKNLIRMCCERIRRAAYLLEDITVSQLAYSLGRLGVRDEEAWACLARVAASRMGSMSAAEIASVTQAAGKVGIRNEALLEAVVEHAMKLQVAFTTQQILNLLDGLVLAGFFHQDLYQSLLHNFVQAGGEDDFRGVNQLRRIMFSILMEFPDFLTRVPQSLQLLAEQHQQPFLHHEQQPFHSELKDCLGELGVDAKILASKGAYTFDARLRLSRSQTRKRVALDLLSEGYYCPVTGSLLGMGRLKSRHFDLLGWTYLTLRRKLWLKNRTREGRIQCLRETLATALSSPGTESNEPLVVNA